MYAAIRSILYTHKRTKDLIEHGSGGYQLHCMLRSMDHSIALPEGSRIVGSVFSGAVIAIKYGRTHVLQLPTFVYDV